MSLEHPPARDANAFGDPAEPDLDYWHSLIDEHGAAAFLKLSGRTLQSLRQRGGGPRYVVISARCLRYRRIDLKSWADARLCTSTSDQAA